MFPLNQNRQRQDRSLRQHQLPIWQTRFPFTYGLRQEAALRHGLARYFEVIASADLDYLQKLDCIVRDRVHPEWPAVGIQLTMKGNDIRKKMATLAAVRATRVVRRCIYLIAESRIGDAAVVPVTQLIRQAAVLDEDVMVVAKLLEESAGQFRTEVSEIVPLETVPREHAIHYRG